MKKLTAINLQAGVDRNGNSRAGLLVVCPESGMFLAFVPIDPAGVRGARVRWEERMKAVSGEEMKLVVSDPVQVSPGHLKEMASHYNIGEAWT
jgi:hypothetical protein